MRTTLVSTCLFASTSIAFATSAFADDAPAKPAFAMMDNTGDGSKINLDVTANIPTDGTNNGVPFRSSLLGQYVAPNGFGGYAGISASTLAFDDRSDNHVGIGNLELGGLYQHALSPDFDLGVRAGLIFPTGSQNLGLHAGNTLLARPADLATALPDTTWLRLGISPTYHRGPVFLRTDLGVDVAVADARGANVLEHINFGVGIEHAGFAATAELQTIFTTEGESFQVAGLSARYLGKHVSPYVAVSTPLDDRVRGEVVTVTTGLTFPF